MADSAEGSPRDKSRFRNAVIGVGIAQLYAWGVIYYPFSVTGKMIAADLGLSIEAAFAGYSSMLLVGAIFAPWVGRAIDRRGGRLTLSFGVLWAAGALVVAAMAKGPTGFYFSCALLGIGSALVLYDAGFAALVQVAGRQGRRAITYVTFLGGFASTVFWPITAFLAERLGWRTTYLVFAAGMIVVCLPIYLATLGRAPELRETSGGGDADGHPDDETPLEGPARRSAFIGFATAIAAHQLVIAGLLIHMIDAVRQAGLTGEQAILVGMAFGPGQVLARFAEMIWGARFPAVVGGRISVILLPPALLFLLSGSMNLFLALCFSAALGMSNGLMTIARGTVALALFGRHGYGAIIGDLALASLFSRAAGPLVLAYGLERWGLSLSALACIACALVGVVAMEFVARIAASQRQERRARIA
ncbi:MAG: MFS transporter [Methylobacteriaceae bacterium]|nr:MFS transporter [Methylobacteriaceae bacterium]